MSPTVTPQAPALARAAGRGYLWLGLGLAVLAVLLFFAQFGMRQLFVPWYLPVMTSLGAVMLLVSLCQRGSVTRVVMLILITALAGLEWYFLVSLSKLPAYEGPAVAGQQFPAFQTTLADGRSFSNTDLQDGTPSVMTFFRGRW